MIDIAQILDVPLPELDNTPRSSARPNSSARVQQRLNRYLSQLQKQSGLSEWLMQFRQHLIGITDRWGMTCSCATTSLAFHQPTMHSSRALVVCAGTNAGSAAVSSIRRPCWTKAPISHGNVMTTKRRFWRGSGGWQPIAWTTNGVTKNCALNKSNDDCAIVETSSAQSPPRVRISMGRNSLSKP